MVQKILVVEDDDGDFELVRHALEGNWGHAYSITHAQTLVEAQDKLDGHDAIILDLGLPDSSGMESLRALAHANQPIIVLTGRDDPMAGTFALANGGADYLTKSQAYPELLERTLRYATVRHRHREGQPMQVPVSVLVVEDDGADREIVVDLLNRSGALQHEVSHAESLEQADGLLETSHIVMLDLGLPDSQGLDTVRKVRTQAPHANLIVITASDELETARGAIQAGAGDYLVKGTMMPEQIRRAIEFAVASRAWEADPAGP